LLYLVPKIEPLMPTKPLSARVDELLERSSCKRVVDQRHPAWARMYEDESSNPGPINVPQGNCCARIPAQALEWRTGRGTHETVVAGHIGWTT
jgi:hypothetical protein